MSNDQAPPFPGQGTASIGEVVTQLQGVIRQLSSSNTNLLVLIAAIKAINFPQNLNGYTVATLPPSPAIGAMAYVVDGAGGLAWGNTITAGGSSKYLGWWNGANWTVVGK